MTQEQRKCRFLDRLQAVGCPVCRSVMEVRRSTWDDPQRKMQALDAYQLKHTKCLQTGVPPARQAVVSCETITPEDRKTLAWRAGMTRHADELQASSTLRSAA